MKKRLVNRRLGPTKSSKTKGSGCRGRGKPMSAPPQEAPARKEQSHLDLYDDELLAAGTSTRTPPKGMAFSEDMAPRPPIVTPTSWTSKNKEGWQWTTNKNPPKKNTYQSTSRVLNVDFCSLATTENSEDITMATPNHVPWALPNPREVLHKIDQERAQDLTSVQRTKRPPSNPVDDLLDELFYSSEDDEESSSEDDEESSSEDDEESEEEEEEEEEERHQSSDEDGDHCENEGLRKLPDGCIRLDDTGEYVVNSLLQARRRKDGRFEFLVRWEGCGSETWEPEENLTKGLESDIERLMVEFDEDASIEDDIEDDIADNHCSITKKKRRRLITPKKRTKKQKSSGSSKKQTKTSKQTNQVGRRLCKDDASPFSVPGANSEQLLELSAVREQTPMCLASRIFGNRLRMARNCKLSHEVQPSESVLGQNWLLIGRSLSENNGGANFYRQQKTQTLYHVVVKGSGLEEISLQTELEKLADFAGIKTRNKAASRLELLFSDAKPAGSSRGFRLIEDLKPDDFEEIEEVDHIGCGFIPEAMMRDILGVGALKNCSSIQVRILAPKFGLFKGMLQTKHGIKRIQLPSSMKKVGPSLVDDSKGLACMLVKNSFPSNRNKSIFKLLRHETLSKSAKSELRIPLNEMICRVLQEAGVELRAILHYQRLLRLDARNVQHTSLVGLCDPSAGSAIPSGYVFLTGFVDHLADIEHVVVSRYPCTSRYDQMTLPVLKEKPALMSDGDWANLTSRHFGEIIFGKPKDGYVPIPETINSGDLDGDLYFVTWYKPFLEGVLEHSQNDNIRPQEADDVEEDTFRNENWLEDVQEYLCDTASQRHLPQLIGCLHHKWKEFVDSRSSDAEAFGEAFKRSLELKKHGGRVYLPGHLWSELKGHLHPFLKLTE